MKQLFWAFVLAVVFTPALKAQDFRCPPDGCGGPNPADYYYPPPPACTDIWGVLCSENPGSGYWPPEPQWGSCTRLAQDINNLAQKMGQATAAACGSDQTCINERNSIEGGCTKSPYNSTNCHGIIGDMKITLQQLCDADPTS